MPRQRGGQADTVAIPNPNLAMEAPMTFAQLLHKVLDHYLGERGLRTEAKEADRKNQ